MERYPVRQGPAPEGSPAPAPTGGLTGNPQVDFPDIQPPVYLDESTGGIGAAVARAVNEARRLEYEQQIEDRLASNPAPTQTTRPAIPPPQYLPEGGGIGGVIAKAINAQRKADYERQLAEAEAAQNTVAPSNVQVGGGNFTALNPNPQFIPAGSSTTTQPTQPVSIDPDPRS